MKRVGWWLGWAAIALGILPGNAQVAPGATAPATGAAAQAATGEDIDVKPAMAAALEWLALVDAGRYGDSWEQGAGALRSAVPRGDWEKALVSARGALGGFLGRKLVAASYARQLPNAPAGEYVVIQYQTRYENRPLAVETITPMREPDGRWRVSGYFIR